METPGASGTTECRYRRKDGDYRWIEITLVNLLDDPVIRGMLGNYHDVTDRRRAEQERRFEQQFTEKLLDSLPGIFYLYTYPDCAWSDGTATMKRCWATAPARSTETYRRMAPSRNGRRRPGRSTRRWSGAEHAGGAAPFQGRDRRPLPDDRNALRAEGRRYLMGIGVDVTERRPSGGGAQESEESLAITLQSIGDAVIATDIRGNITRMNDTAERLTGWSLAEAMGNRCRKCSTS
jgi:PAS domain-containing protein